MTKNLAHGQRAAETVHIGSELCEVGTDPIVHVEVVVGDQKHRHRGGERLCYRSHRKLGVSGDLAGRNVRGPAVHVDGELAAGTRCRRTRPASAFLSCSTSMAGTTCESSPLLAGSR